MYRCLRDCDVPAAMALWQHARPDMPQPENTHQALIMIHYARTKMRKLPSKLRFYSHCWLIGEGLPSGLPDNMRSRAERMYPVVANAVGVSSGSGPGSKGPLNFAIEKVMAEAVLEAYADGHSHEPDIVKARILEKRAEFKRRA
jgi:hypothetical protein